MMKSLPHENSICELIMGELWWTGVISWQPDVMAFACLSLQTLHAQSKASEQTPKPCSPVRLFLKPNPITKLSVCFCLELTQVLRDKNAVVIWTSSSCDQLLGLFPVVRSAPTGDMSLTMLSWLCSPLLGMMMWLLLLPFSCSEHKELWVRKLIASFFFYIEKKKSCFLNLWNTPGKLTWMEGSSHLSARYAPGQVFGLVQNCWASLGKRD